MRTHGIAGTYAFGCRCQNCRDAAAEAKRRLRGPKKPPERLRVTCWCEKSTVLVAIDDIRDGRTGSCGRLSCTPERIA